jgi:hypothetical protein
MHIKNNWNDEFILILQFINIFCLWFCYYVVSIRDCVASVVGQLVRKGFGSGHGLNKAVFWNLLGRTEENHEKSQVRWCPSWNTNHTTPLQT